MNQTPQGPAPPYRQNPNINTGNTAMNVGTMGKLINSKKIQIKRALNHYFLFCHHFRFKCWKTTIIYSSAAI